MSKAIAVAFHKYQPYGGEYYEPILDFFLLNARRWWNEFDRLYLLDSTWNIIHPPNPKIRIIRVDPSLRYYDAYKTVLPQIEEDKVLFLDNDMVIWKEGIVQNIFSLLNQYDVVSIYDTIGNNHFLALGGQSKFCPYLFAAEKEKLQMFTGCEWGPNMPEHETLGKLTEEMLGNGLTPVEIEEDKTSIYFNGTKDGEHGKRFGYYHIRAGSVPALLLAYRKYDHDKFEDYIFHQPKQEYLRQMMWYTLMCNTVQTDDIVMQDLNIALHDMGLIDDDIEQYIKRFIEYHGLPYEENNRRTD